MCFRNTYRGMCYFSGDDTVPADIRMMPVKHKLIPYKTPACLTAHGRGRIDNRHIWECAKRESGCDLLRYCPNRKPIRIQSHLVGILGCGHKPQMFIYVPQAKMNKRELATERPGLFVKRPCSYPISRLFCRFSFLQVR